MSGMWYTAKDVMILLDVGESTAYKIMTKLGSEISKKKVPGKEDILTKMVEEAVKKAMEPETKPTEVTADNLEQTVTEAVAKAMAPILAQRGISQNLNGEPVTKSQGEPHYMAGMF